MKHTSRRIRPVRRTVCMVIGDGLLLALAMTGLFLFQFNVYGLPGSRSVVLYACLAASVLSLVVFSLPKYRWAVVLCLIVLGGNLLWWYWDSVSQGAQAVYSTVAHVITESTDFPGEFPIPKTWTEEEIWAASNHFLTAIIFALSLPLGWAVVRRRTFLPVLLLTLPWLMPIFLAEFPPDVVSLSMLAACWIALLLTGLTTRRDPQRGARLTLVALPAGLLALCCICLMFPVETYVYPDWAAAAAQQFTEFGEELQARLMKRDAEETIDLTHAGPKSYTGRSVLKVESDWIGRVYLRGASYANYSGGSWERLNDQAQAELDGIIQDNSLALSMESELPAQTYSATITHLNRATRMAYYPYQPSHLEETLGGASYVADSYLRLDEARKEYTIEFSDLDIEYVPNSIVSSEAYSRFVYEHYTDVPEELNDILRDWWRDEAQNAFGGLMPPGPYQAAIAQTYANILETTTQYDLQTPVTPKGEDFVAYFLTTSHRGYCVHYASAVVLLLRMSDIPARYVSGYTAEIKDGEALVPDSAAHAWVEVYVDGYGWYPVEVTPAAAFADTTVEETPNGASTPTAQPAPSAEPSQPPAQSTPEVTPEPSQAPTAAPGIDGSGEGQGPLINLTWLYYAAAALVILGLPVLYRALRHRRWNRLSAISDNNRAVLEAYGWYQKLSPWSGKPNQRLEEMARKAKFSQHTLTDEERQEAIGILRQEIIRLSSIRSWKRPLFWYLFVWK